MPCYFRDFFILCFALLVTGCVSGTRASLRIEPTYPANPPRLSVRVANIEIDGKPTVEGKYVTLNPAATTITFSGLLSVAVAYSRPVDKSEDASGGPAENIACLALLPLCSVIRYLNHARPEEFLYEEKRCTAQLKFRPLEDEGYLVHIVRDDPKLPLLELKRLGLSPARMGHRRLSCVSQNI